MDFYQTSFELILHAGNAKSSGMLAIEEARAYQFTDAQKHLDKAKEELKIAHKTQTDLIKTEANGGNTTFSILLVHAQDHLTSAMNTLDQAEEFMHIYRIFSKLEGGI